jgi:DNA-binding transcriptional regulator PaaX
MPRLQFKDILLEVTDNVLEKVTDVILTEIFFSINIFGTHNSYEINRAADDAYKLVSYKINYQTIKRTISYMIQSGMIKRTGGYRGGNLSITDKGSKRVIDLIPTYHKERPWNGYLYLVSYDIPNSHNRSRDILRQYLKKLSCGLLQESLWMTPYNPTQNVTEYISERNIPGTILVSKLGKDGSIGDETREELITRIYHLKELDIRYGKYIKIYAHPSPNPFQQYLSYSSILKDDPQLPFSLEPTWFKAKSAYQITKSILHNFL